MAIPFARAKHGQCYCMPLPLPPAVFCCTISLGQAERGKIVKASPELLFRCEEEQYAYSKGILHEHCENCFSQYCDVTPNYHSACEVIDCDIGCGQRLHACKLKEHKNVCQQEKVACPNCSLGCPVDLVRSKISSHIQVCPASVIRCVIEWNRWPMHSQEENIKASLPLNNPHVKCKQLDVALALRDQRMLLESMKAPKRVHKIFQNSITRRYPSVPFGTRSESFDSDCLSDSTSVTVSDDESDAPWESSNLPPGLKSSVCSRLYRASENVASSLSTMSGYIATKHDKNSSRERAKEQQQKVQCALCHKKKEFEVHEDGDEQETNHSGLSTNVKELNTNSKNVSPLTPESVHEELAQSSGDSCSISCSQSSNLDLLNIGSSFENDYVDFNGHETVTSGRDDTNVSGAKLDQYQEVELDEIYKKDIKLHELLGVSLNIECISKYIPKPLKMYTFLCANDYRRDEYSWHFKNIHNDIHCGLNGIMEQRCPLAYQGCTFSYSRLTPSLPDSKIVHSSLLESFGLLTSADQDFEMNNDERPRHSQISEKVQIDLNFLNHEKNKFGADNATSQADKHRNCLREATPEIITSQKFDSKINIIPRFRKNSGCDDSHSSRSPCIVQPILSLPFEILQYIALYLDGFSLNNLAMTCKLLRSVSCSLLAEKGMVVLVWERKKSGTNGRLTWQISYKKWCFSTCFSPVRHWKHQGQGPLLEHLRVCPFYSDDHKNIRTEQWQYISCTDAPNLIRECDKVKTKEKETAEKDDICVIVDE